jgi:predicted phage-related endonuclease
MTISAEQLAFKKGKIGASQSASCLGYNKFSTPAQEFHRMQGNMPTFVETTAVRVGSAMEPTILNEYNILNDYDAVPYEETLVHADEPRIIAHCDAKDHKRNVLVEIKNVGPRMKDNWKDGAPDYVKIQACHQSMLDQTPDVDIVAYFGGNDVRVFPQVFTEENWASLYDNLKDFLGYVDRNECPPLDKADLPFLKHFYRDAGTSIEADERIYNYAKSLFEDKASLKPDKDLEGHIKEAEFEIQKYMGNNSTLLDQEGNTLYTWKEGKAKRVVDWEEFTKHVYQCYLSEVPNAISWNDMFDKFVSEKKSSRRFLCKLK